MYKIYGLIIFFCFIILGYFVFKAKKQYNWEKLSLSGLFFRMREYLPLTIILAILIAIFSPLFIMELINVLNITQYQIAFAIMATIASISLTIATISLYRVYNGLHLVSSIIFFGLMILMFTLITLFTLNLPVSSIGIIFIIFIYLGAIASISKHELVTGIAEFSFILACVCWVFLYIIMT